MRLSSFLLDGKATYGVVDERGVIDLGARFVGRYADLKALLAGNGLTEAEVYARSDYVDAKVDDVSFLPVIPNPGKIFCIGHNYEDHRVETQRAKTEHKRKKIDDRE